ncbi:Ig-like V-type domain-containing protein FAM187A [Brachionichthys hirsutus]|uniref:Ig-like V-type domain-containing protein FAM187A n=1 Tax=Brachionichthys hirsutus TaxID=412623 RepID=UPI003604E2F9
MPRPLRPLFLLFLLLFLRTSWSYEAPREEEDVFASRACPAFLTFINAAYLAGVTVELPCHCKPPQVQAVVWFFKKHLDSSAEMRALTDYHGNKLLDPSRVPHSGSLRSRFSIRLFSLLIFRAGTADAGVYICGSAYSDFFYGYDLDIQESRRIRESPRKKATDRNRLGSVSSPFRVFTSFRPWSVCDRCGVPGEQIRVGLCYVHSRYLHARYRRTNQTVASCGSGGVPRAFGELKQSGVGATLEVKSCKVECPDHNPKSSRKLALMSFLGFNSASLPVEVPVFFLKHPANRVLTLGCPGARPTMAVAWDIGSTPIYRSEHAAGRLVIDSGHHLLFNPAEPQDSGVYYCWLQGRQAAEIHLLVYAHLGRGQSVTSHPEFGSALNTVLVSYAVMAAVFCLLQICRGGIRHFRDSGGTHVD